MYKRLLALLSLLSLIVTVPAFGFVDSDKVIYGDDDRVDVYASDNALFIDLARSTAAMIGHSSMTAMGDDIFRLSGSTLQSRGICASEPFAQQLSAARCSGFLVGEDLLVTAGHCVRSSSDCSNYAWVFDYKMDDPNKINFDLNKNDIYKCKEIIERSQDYRTKDDYALIRLERKVTDRTPLTFRTEGKVEVGQELVVIGHPSGLPTKIADGAAVRDNNPGTYFIANLDTYGGNSGSAVFDAETGDVEGILVRGETDYVYDSNQGCRVSNVCTDDGCRGEDVTRITNIKALMNN